MKIYRLNASPDSTLQASSKLCIVLNLPLVPYKCYLMRMPRLSNQARFSGVINGAVLKHKVMEQWRTPAVQLKWQNFTSPRPARRSLGLDLEF
ncbi:hypothetical protein GUJ93_ZPchr0012g20425 [Zizania palustris]|uniref:Uncharacterized protein n=1 Tax=Zizania palustris TaxID=103762 RepID=A0A8J5WTM1_ZIZPA|nr:hypothetical protein GUJ93_ZPchr0012g20425 [Zizania palustris]KAG8093318.1 hypothetical protein GUJ93_ZPchr0012g20425 [Zizania palustris]